MANPRPRQRCVEGKFGVGGLRHDRDLKTIDRLGRAHRAHTGERRGNKQDQPKL
jgi:hypothetical protein